MAVPAEKLGGFDSAGAATVVFAAAAGELEAAGTEAVGFGDPKENIPLPTIGAGLLSVLLVAVVGDPKLKEAALAAGDAKAVELLAVVVVAAPAASEPKLTVGLLCSVVVVLLLLFAAFGVVSTGLPKENPTLLGVSAGFLLEDGDPKLNPLVVVVEVTASDVFEASAGLEPKLNPPDAGFGASAFSAGLEPESVVSDVAAGLLPKLKPVPAGLGAAAALGVVVPLPKLNLGLSSAVLDVLVVDVTDPNVKPVLPEVDVLVDELAGGTPKENPVLGASAAVLEVGGTPKLNLAPEEDDDDGLLPKEKEGASSGVDPGLACSQQAHLEREASFRVIHALHSHLLADCCATSALNP